MSFAYYRLPHTQQAFRNRQNAEPEEMSSAEELNGRRGFVIAPFDPSPECPILLLPAEWEPVNLNSLLTHDSPSLTDTGHDKERKQYAADFANFHAQLADGTFDKIVLARSTRLTANGHISAVELFARACDLYPRMFIALFGTKRSGTWLVATPEVLVSGHKGNMRTMALAGTMRLSGKQLNFDIPTGNTCNDEIHWSAKNIAEQHYVETYITECIDRQATDIETTGPYTTRAGDLVHLRSDIRFKLGDTSRIGNLIGNLHPTPAVCGIPKDATRQFINHNEPEPRRYYSGFAGPLDPNGDTNLFVTLRCMHIDDCGNGQTTYRLHAGGGLLKDSTEQSEWDETEAKMNTMLQLFKYV